MVGGHVLDLCLEHEGVGKVTSLTRKASGKNHAKLNEIIHSDYEDFGPINDQLANQDAIIFCIGVYTGAVPREVFRKITVDMPVNLAKAVQAKNPNIRFCLLSGAGADRTEKRRAVFAKDKGAAENQLDALGMGGGFHSFRPAYIYPVEPRDEPNFMYSFSRWLYKPLISKMGKNASITSLDLARGMVKVGLEGGNQVVYENAEILDLL